MVKSQESRVKSQRAKGPPRWANSGRRAESRKCGFALRSYSGSRLSTLDSRLVRRGITLTEVLISLGILTLGLLGVAAIFPVGSWYMQKAVIADNGSALAQAVMNDIVTRGTVDPKSWYAFVPVPTSHPANMEFPNADGKYLSTAIAPRNTFTRPVADALREALYQAAAANDLGRIDTQFGNAFVIDPLYVAAAVQKSVAHNNNAAAYAFPASAVRAAPRDNWPYYYNAPEWAPWIAPSANERMWPIRRVTLQDTLLQSGNRGWAMGPEMASHYFRGGDDLTTDLPSRADRPARQNWDTIRSGSITTPLARQRTGDFSWIVCVVPTTRAARDGLATNPESYSYDVSVVVFYKRILPTGFASVEGINPVAAYERAVSAKILSTGLNGGELRLQALLNNGNPQQPVDGMPEDPFKNLRTGEWIMVCGPHPNSTISEPRFVMKWYQVLAIDTEGLAKTDRNVTVRGPEWPWKPFTGTYSASNPPLANDLCVGIFRGAVAVHTKTIKLEGEHGAGMAVVKP